MNDLVTVIKRTGRIAFFALLSCTLLSACKGASSENAGKAQEDELSIVVTIFPQYDWVQNILGENPAGAKVRLLVDNGVDLHSYQPSVEDIVEISESELLIYVGGESDEWVEDVLEEGGNPSRVSVNLLDVLGRRAKTEETVEGMQTDEQAECDAEYDEHVWLSLKNASVLCEAIEKAIEEADPAHADVYRTNLRSYQDELEALDTSYQEAVDASDAKTILFGDRFPFRYMTDDYGLTYYAAFSGCSAETEASFETITFLANKVDELHLPAVLKLEDSDGRIAETIVENTKEKSAVVLTLNSMQAVRLQDTAAGTGYLSIMRDNLAVLKQAL